MLRTVSPRLAPKRVAWLTRVCAVALSLGLLGCEPGHPHAFVGRWARTNRSGLRIAVDTLIIRWDNLAEVRATPSSPADTAAPWRLVADWKQRRVLCLDIPRVRDCYVQALHGDTLELSSGDSSPVIFQRVR
ncbi:MAG: hypothetical protein ACR2OG_15385 [Gemmatimonadaceae bacterium]